MEHYGLEARHQSVPDQRPMSIGGIRSSGMRPVQGALSLDQAMALLMQAATRSLRKHGLQASDWAVLLRLRRCDGPTLQQLASGAGLHKATASRTVKRLLVRGYVDCGPAAQVSQGYCIALSEKGRQLIERRYSHWSVAELFPESVLSPQDLGELASILEKIARTGGA